MSPLPWKTNSLPALYTHLEMNQSVILFHQMSPGCTMKQCLYLLPPNKDNISNLLENWKILLNVMSLLDFCILTPDSLCSHLRLIRTHAQGSFLWTTTNA